MTRSARTRERSSARIAVRVDEDDVADDGIGAEHVHLDVEADDVELVREPFDPAAMPEPDARAFVERANDLHRSAPSGLTQTMSQVTTSSSSMSMRATRPTSSSMNFGFTP